MIVLTATIGNTTVKVYQASESTWYVSEEVSDVYTVLTESREYYELESALAYATAKITNLGFELF